MGHSRKTRLSFYSNNDSIRTDTLRQKIHDSYWPTAEIHSSRTRIDSNTVEHPPRVWFEAACLSDQPFLLREGSLAECNRRPCLPLNGAHVAQEQFTYR